MKPVRKRARKAEKPLLPPEWERFAADPGFIGIDPSLTATGVVMMTKGGEELSFTMSPKTKDAARLEDFFTCFDMIFDHDWACAAVEGYGFGARDSRAHSLGELGGIIRLLAHRHRVPTLIVPPTSLKMFVSGKGNIKKDQVTKEVYKRWEFDAPNDNEADAYALVRMAQARYIEKVDTAFQQKALDGASWLNAEHA